MNTERWQSIAYHVSEHQARELSRCAQAMYSNGSNAAGHMLSAVAATYWNKAATSAPEIQRIDRAMEIYRAWLCFNEYPQA